MNATLCPLELPDVQECDATDADSSNAAQYTKNPRHRSQWITAKEMLELPVQTRKRPSPHPFGLHLRLV